MRKSQIIIVAGVLCVTGVVYGQARSTGGFRHWLVQAQCLSGLTPVACAGVVFGNGFLRIKRLKQPKLVQSTVVGKIRMNKVSPAQPGLDAKVTGLVSYKSDPDSDCPLADTQVLADPFATATMTCVLAGDGLSSTCQGVLQRPAATAATCSDVTFIVENIQAEVYEDGSVGDPAGLIARNGMAVLGRSPDCDSGGSGCP